MYKNFSIYDFCAFFILMGMIISIYVRKLWKNKTSQIFLECMFLSTVVIVSNSIFINLNSLKMTNGLVILSIILKNIYFLGLLLVILSAYVYTISTMGLMHLLKSRNNKFSIILMIISAIPIVFTILSIPNQWIFEFTAEAGYKVKFGSYIYYSFLIIILMFAMVTSIEYRRFLTKTKFIDCMILFPINIFSLFHQMIIPEYSFIMFVITMSFYVISITTHRPEELINPTLNAKTAQAFYSDTKTVCVTEKKVTHVYVKIANHSQIKKYIGNQTYIAFLRNVSDQITEIISKYKTETEFYYLEDSEFCLSIESDDKKAVKNISTRVSELFYNEYEFAGFNLYPDVRICVVNVPEDISNYGYLVYFAKVFHNITPVEKTPVYFNKISKSKEFLIRNDIEVIVEGAAENNRIDVEYQPIYDVENKCFTSAEALVRLNDPKYGDVDPELFIPVAEISGDIFKIGDVVLRKVLSFISSSQFKNSGLKYIEVNLTLSQCMEKNFVEKIFSMLKEYNVKPEQLRFEITENMEGYNVDIIESNIYRLHEAGIVFELDDYGTGYSNIKQVLQLPVDVVKLDKAFVQEIEDYQMQIVINDTISMLRNLNKDVLVEGVETKDILEYFVDLKCDTEGSDEPVRGCQFIQGYVFSEALDENSLVQFLGNNQ